MPAAPDPGNPPPPAHRLRLAAVATGPRRLEVREVASAPTPPNVWRRVAIRAAGICGTDLKILDGEVDITHPRILGHEAVGVIVEASGEPGPGGSTLADGTRVLIDPTVTCGRCRRCRRDLGHLCGAGGLLGRDLDGVFTTEVVVDPAQLLPLPDPIPDEEGPLLQILGTCVHAQDLVVAEPGQVAVVVGLGVSGLLHLQLLRARGIDIVVGVSRTNSKLAAARRLGATATATPTDASTPVTDLTNGEGADLVIETSGTLAGLRSAVELVAPAGTILQFGTISATEGALPYYELYAKELTVVSARAARPRDYALAIDHVARGRVALAPLVSDRYPLHRAVEAFARVRNDADALKVTLTV